MLRLDYCGGSWMQGWQKQRWLVWTAVRGSLKEPGSKWTNGCCNAAPSYFD